MPGHYSDGLWVVDTNVVVAGLLSQTPDSPPSRILDKLLDGQLRCLLCVELLAEYRKVLLRKKIRARHALDEQSIDKLLESLVAPAVIGDISGRKEMAPDIGDNHLWQLLAAHPEAGLITGDSLLLRNPPAATIVVSPGDFLQQFSNS